MKILALGDSHTRDYFNYIQRKGKTVRVRVCGVSGGTAYGLKNINSQSQCHNKILQFLSTREDINEKVDLVIFLIGEGDCGYLIYCNAERLNISINESLNLSIQNLFEFIEKIINIFSFLKNKICIMGVTLPAIEENDKSEVSQKRQYITTKYSRKLLTTNTIKFNMIIKNKCQHFNYKYFDITSYIIDKNTDLLNSKFKLAPETNDHHLNPELIYKFIVNEIIKLK